MEAPGNFPGLFRWLDCGEASRGLQMPVDVTVTDRSFHAALARSAIATRDRRIRAAPLRRSSGCSQSAKKTTFMSGRTRAALPCLWILEVSAFGVAQRS